MKYFAAYLGLAIALASLPVRAQSTPDDQYVSIYSLIQQADSLQAAGQPRQALTEYTQAAQQLEKFQKAFPDWNMRIVNFRLNYLTQKISGLTAQLPAINAPATNAPPATMTATPATTATTGVVVVAPSADVVALRAQLQNLETVNANLEAKLKEALSAQPVAANSQELEMAQAQVKALTKENELLRAESTVPATAQPAASAQDLKEAQLALAGAKEKLTEQTQRADKLALENQSLQARLQPLLKNPDAAQALREENAMLKKQVAALQAKTPAGTAGANAEVAKLQAQVAAMQSDADVNWLEKMALENRLKQSSQSVSTPPPVEETTVPSTAANDMGSLSTSSFQTTVNTGAQNNSTTPGDLSSLIAQAQSEIEANKLSDADQHLHAALAQNPNDSVALSSYGYLKFRQQKYDEALDALTHASQLDPQNAQIQNYLGVTLSHKGLSAEAETALLKAVELDPGYAAAHNNLAVIYINAQPPRPELARWHYQKALEAGQPRNADLEKLLAGKGAPVADQ